MKLVFPATWSGAPPVMMTCWPDSMWPAFRAALMEKRITSSVVSAAEISTGMTPQQSERKSNALSLGVVARIGCFGRKRDTRQAVDPDQVGVTLAAASISFAMK